MVQFLGTIDLREDPLELFKSLLTLSEYIRQEKDRRIAQEVLTDIGRRIGQIKPVLSPEDKRAFQKFILQARKEGITDEEINQIIQQQSQGQLTLEDVQTPILSEKALTPEEKLKQFEDDIGIQLLPKERQRLLQQYKDEQIIDETKDNEQIVRTIRPFALPKEEKVKVKKPKPIQIQAQQPTQDMNNAILNKVLTYQLSGQNFLQDELTKKLLGYQNLLDLFEKRNPYSEAIQDILSRVYQAPVMNKGALLQQVLPALSILSDLNTLQQKEITNALKQELIGANLLLRAQDLENRRQMQEMALMQREQELQLKARKLERETEKIESQLKSLAEKLAIAQEKLGIEKEKLDIAKASEEQRLEALAQKLGLEREKFEFEKERARIEDELRQLITKLKQNPELIRLYFEVSDRLQATTSPQIKAQLDKIRNIIEQELGISGAPLSTQQPSGIGGQALKKGIGRILENIGGDIKK